MSVNIINRNRVQIIRDSATTKEAICPINTLKSDCTNFRIRAKILIKSPFKEWSKHNKTYQNFMVLLCDKDGHRIEGTFWSDDALK